MPATLKRSLSLVFCFFAVSSATAKDGDWSGWRGSNDASVQWRFRVNPWGSMPSDCDVEFRLNVEGTSNFMYDITYIVHQARPGESRHRARSAYSVARDYGHQGEHIDDCRTVSGVDITPLAHRAGPKIDRESAHNGTKEVPKPRPIPSANPGGGTRGLPSHDPKGPSGGSSAGPFKDVIEFPGPYKGPTLLNLRPDRRSDAWMLSEAHTIGNSLLDWRPMHAWARHTESTITQEDWDALATLVSRKDKALLRELSIEATRHANEYVADSNMGRFWRAMAEVYRRQGLK